MKSNARTWGILATVALVVTVALLLLVRGDGGGNAPAVASTVPVSSTVTTPPTSVGSPLDLAGFAPMDGTYQGDWGSEAFGGGRASIAVDVDPTAGAIAVDFGLEGQLLEQLITQLAPTDGAVNLMGDVDATFTETGTATGSSAVVGPYTMTLGNGGEMSLIADDVSGPHVATVELKGTLEPECFMLDYRITFDGTDTVLEGTIELCRLEDGGVAPPSATSTTATYTVEVLDQSAQDPVPGTGVTTATLIFECGDGRCGGSIGINQITYPDGTGQRGGFRDFTYDAASETYSFDETMPDACEQERWYGTISPTEFDDRGPIGFTLAGGHDASGNCGFQLVYEMTAVRDSVSP